ncbi:MAG: hypothetical protein GX633_05090 [Clostridiales bacterium]|nr:hypothetical protein [Clostridiales bacterium]
MLDVKKIFDSFPTLERIPMKPHPRLYIDEKAVENLRRTDLTPGLALDFQVVDKIANESLANTTIQFNEAGHNSMLIRARYMQTRIYCLLCKFLQTGEEKYRKAVLDHIREIDSWPYWSWFEWRAKCEPDWEAPFVSFDLSYGENSMTLGIAYDVLYNTLSPEEKEIFYSCLKRHRVITEFLRHCKIGRGSGRDMGDWIQNEKCNWITVTCGGMGMLALAFYDELEEARQALALCDLAVMSLMVYADECGGSWPEGLSYYNYTLRYAIAFLISYETATGRRHPAFDLPGTAEMNSFFLNFQPNGIPCTFGDNNTLWEPMGYNYHLAQRLGQTHLCPALDKAARYGQNYGDCWPYAAERLLFSVCDDIHKVDLSPKNVVKLYPGTNFAVMADSLPSPEFYMAIRGGNTNGAHEHNDLSSFHLVAGEEMFITSLTTDEYLDTTFSPRRDELFEMTPLAKNVLLVNGVGMEMYSQVEQREKSYGEYRGIEMDCSEAMGTSRDSFCAVDSYIRDFIMLTENAFLIVDRAYLPNPGRFDLRFHTFTAVKKGEKCVVLSGKTGRKIKISFDATKQCLLLIGLDTPTKPKEPSKVIRFASELLHKDIVYATLLSTDLNSSLKLCDEGIEAVINEKTHIVKL